MQNMNKKERLEALISHFDEGRPSRFAKRLGVSPSTISTWMSRNTIDYDLIFAKCKGVSPGWLLTGEGNMIKAELAAPKDTQLLVSTPMPKATTPTKRHSKTEKKGVPLISQTAMAGYFAGEEDADINAYDYFVIPSFKNVDFLIRISGDSMEPTYRSGDIVACQVVPMQDIFFQWNRPYIIDTNQGALLKRIRQGEDNDHLLIVSDNPEYPPFQLHKSHFYHVALVKGIVRAE